MKDAAQTERQKIRENTGNRTVALENPKAVIRYAGAPRRFLQELESFVKTHVASDAVVYTDEHAGYNGLLNHESIIHGRKEYVRVYTCHGDGKCPAEEPCVPEKMSTNGIESVWAVLRRVLYWVYHSVSKKHLRHYSDELGGRLNSRDLGTLGRIMAMFRDMDGRRLRYQDLIA